MGDGDGLIDLTVSLADDVRVLDGGRLLVGGSPMRAVRVSEAGRQVVGEWHAGGPIGPGAARAALARRLLDHDILRPRPRPARSTAEVTVVIPARDRLPALERCLRSVRDSAPESALIVVDDGSTDSDAVDAAGRRAGGTVIRHPRPAGPGAARNSGLRACTTQFVAFVDSDAVLAPRAIERLLGHFVDPRVGAVAPRVTGLPGAAGAIGRYEQRHSPLDMGADGGRVGPGRRVPYVPAVTLVIRRQAAGQGFDGSLEVGEDVDFIWRLVEAGWDVRYEPGVHVWHDHRDTLRSFLTRRREYAASVAVLARRHPGAVPAIRVSRQTALPWLLVLLGHPRLALLAAGWDLGVAGRRLARVSDDPWRLAGRLMVRGLLGTGDGLARVVRRGWLVPLVAIAIRRPRTLGIVYAAFLERLVRDARRAQRPETFAIDAAIRVLDELAALAGTWEGCARERTIAPLLPSWEGGQPA